MGEPSTTAMSAVQPTPAALDVLAAAAEKSADHPEAGTEKTGTVGNGAGGDSGERADREEGAAAKPYARVRGPYKKKLCGDCGNRLKQCVCGAGDGGVLPGICWWSVPPTVPYTNINTPLFAIPVTAAEPPVRRKATGRVPKVEKKKSAAKNVSDAAFRFPLPSTANTSEKMMVQGASAGAGSQPPHPPSDAANQVAESESECTL